MTSGITDRWRLRELLRFCYMAFLFSAPWSISASQISLEFCILFYVLIIVTTGHNPFVRSLRSFYIVVALWWVWLVVAALAGPTPGRSLWLSRGEWLFFAVPIGAYLLRDTRHHTLLFSSLVAGMALVSVQGMAQFFFGVGWLASQPPEPAADIGYRVSGAFSGYVTFAAFFSVATTALVGYLAGSWRQLSQKHRYALTAMSVIGFVLTVMSLGRIALVALVTGLALVFFLAGGKRRLGAMASVVAALVLVLLVPGLRVWFADAITAETELRDSSRRFVWRGSVQIVEEHPWTGIGAGQFAGEYRAHVRSTNIKEEKLVSHAHNDVLHFAAILGIPGALIYLALWVVTLRFFVRRVMRQRDGPSLAALGGSICLFVISMFHGVFVDEEVRALLMFLWAVGLAGEYNERGLEASATADLSA